jgi:hypothetical protein
MWFHLSTIIQSLLFNKHFIHWNHSQHHNQHCSQPLSVSVDCFHILFLIVSRRKAMILTGRGSTAGTTASSSLIHSATASTATCSFSTATFLQLVSKDRWQVDGMCLLEEAPQPALQPAPFLSPLPQPPWHDAASPLQLLQYFRTDK